MAKFTLECPVCGTLNKASTFVLAKKEITCGNCHANINVKANRITSRKCPHCDNIFIYDQAKSRNVCPVCHKNVKVGQGKLIEFPCPQCSCIIQVDQNTGTTTCPVCDCLITDVTAEYKKSKLVNDSSISVIKYEGDNGTFVWKHPIEDFNLGSQLIVHQSQEAIFFLNGKAMDTFGPGRYSLETENLPLLKKAYSLPTNKQNPFHAEVYFINKAVQMGVKWGTDSRVGFVDPLTGIPLDIGASGNFNLAVDNSRLLLEKIVGTTGGLTRNQIVAACAADAEEAPTKTAKGWAALMQGLFRPMLMTHVKTFLATAITENNIDILQINSQLEFLSQKIHEKVAPEFEKYGLFVPEFYVTNIALPEDDKNFRRIRELRTVPLSIREAEAQQQITVAQRQVMLAQQQTELERKRMEAEQKKVMVGTDIELEKQKGMASVEVKRQEGLAEAEVMREKGYSEKDVIAAEVQKSYAESIGQFGANGGGATTGTGGSGVMNDMLGLGVGLAAAKAVGGQMSEMLGDMQNAANHQQQGKPEGWKCFCGETDNKGLYCSHCGSPKPEPWDCPNCGAKSVLGRFCPNCGAKRSSLWDCAYCGAKNNRGRFCSECGKEHQTDAGTWNCSCGEKNNRGRFCSACGKKKEEAEG